MSPLVVLFRVISLVVSLTTAKNGLPSNEPRYQARGSRVREVLHGAGYQFDMGDSRNMFAWQTHDQGTMCAAGTGVDDTIGATRRERASREPSHVR